MAEELDLKYELFPIGPRTGETRTKEYTDLNSKQKISCMQDGEFALTESLSICRYLQNVYLNDSVALQSHYKLTFLPLKPLCLLG